MLPEPLAVNRGEKVAGSIRFKVNESRSYDLTVNIGVERSTDAALRRVAGFNLSQQTFK